MKFKMTWKCKKKKKWTKFLENETINDRKKQQKEKKLFESESLMAG